MLHTTLALLHQHGACTNGYRKLVRHLGGSKAWPADRPIPLTTVLDSNGCDDAVWCLRAVLPAEAALCERIARLFAADCAEDAGTFTRCNAYEITYEAAIAAAWNAAYVAARNAKRSCSNPVGATAAHDAAWAAALVRQTTLLRQHLETASQEME